MTLPANTYIPTRKQEQPGTAGDRVRQQDSQRQAEEQQGTVGDSDRQPGTAQDSQAQRQPSKASRGQPGTIRHSDSHPGPARASRWQPGAARDTWGQSPTASPGQLRTAGDGSVASKLERSRLEEPPGAPPGGGGCHLSPIAYSLMDVPPLRVAAREGPESSGARLEGGAKCSLGPLLGQQWREVFKEGTWATPHRHLRKPGARGTQRG